MAALGNLSLQAKIIRVDPRVSAAVKFPFLSYNP